MKSKWLLAALIAASSWSWVTADVNDPVVMKINDKEIYKSEFEYIYNKNSQQQIDQKSRDEYVVLFKNYKLKVAEAEAAGIDTTEAFRKELAGYRDELAKPYLVDGEIDEQLCREAYERMKEDVEVSHILVGLNARTVEARTQARLLADSLATALKQGADFADIARRYSEDGTKQAGGYLGFISGGRTVYPFEKAAFALNPGEISEVVETQFGYHIIKQHSRRANPGEYLFAHIMLMVPSGTTDEQKAQKEAEIRSIYDELRSGADIATLAQERSDDKGTAIKGGELPWASSGQFIKEFEEAGFALKNKGDITMPVKTVYGWHIIKLLDKRDVRPYEQMRGEIKRMMVRDERGSMARKAMVEKLKKDYNFAINNNAKVKLVNLATAKGVVDTTYIATIQGDQDVLFSFANQSYTIADFANYLPQRPIRNSVAGYVNTMIENMGEQYLLDLEKSLLEEKYPEFRNLMSEYRDGMLLFEISNREVWEKAAKDTQGLQKYFKKNKRKYKWDKPHYKGFVIHCNNEATAEDVKVCMNGLEADSVVTVLNREFNTDSVTAVKVERGLYIKGDNKYIDQYVFEGETVKVDEDFPVVFVSGKLLKKYPEDYTDVRGQVIADYQTYLEQVWVRRLNKKYAVEINKDVLKTVNKQ